MKRRKKLILLCGVILFLTCGCSNNTKELEDKIKILEDKIDKLEESNNNNKSLTKKDLVGVWESSSGITITINEDGAYVPSGNENNNLYFSFEIFDNTLIICSNVGTPITNCLDETTYNDGITIIEKYIPLTYSVFQYKIINNDKLSLWNTTNNAAEKAIIWTKIN